VQIEKESEDSPMEEVLRDPLLRWKPD
jgi:hypothetical protein